MHPSVIEEEDDVRVIDKISLPELHILMGVVNHIFWGKGGACCKLLLKSGHLASHECLEDVVNNNQVIAISSTLQAMNRLVDACFCNDLKGNVGILLDEFALLYKSLNMTTTLKVHVLMEHLIQIWQILEARE